MIVPVGLQQGITSGVIWCACLAYPGLDDAPRRARWITAVRGVLYKSRGKQIPFDPGLPRTPKRENIMGVVHDGQRHILHRRIPALWLAQKLLLPPSEGGLRRQDAYIALYNELPAEFGYSDETDVRKRCWRELLPVLAMAAPVAELIQRAPPGWSATQALTMLMYDGAWTNAAIATARRIAPVFDDAFTPDRLYVPYNAKSPVSCPDNSATDQALSLHHLGERT